MIHISLPDLSQESIYSRVLQTIEDVCDEYGIVREFGCISTACMEIEEYLEQRAVPYSVDMDLYLESDSLEVSFTGSEPVFDSFEDFRMRESVISSLIDKLELTTDNKTVSMTFLVKTHPVVNRVMAPVGKTVCHF